MTLGDIIKEYRKNHNLSMDAFSDRSGISKAYISLLEKNKHPKTGNSIAPSIQSIKQAADGMNMDFNILFSMIDGDVILKESEKSDGDKQNSQGHVHEKVQILQRAAEEEQLTDEDLEDILSYAKFKYPKAFKDE